MNKSNKENREYGGFIYEIKNGDGFSYTTPVHGTERNIEVYKFNSPPKGCKNAAVYHTHPGTGYNVPYFSTFDYITANFYGSIYLGTASGLVKEWSPRTDERIVRKPFRK